MIISLFFTWINVDLSVFFVIAHDVSTQPPATTAPPTTPPTTATAPPTTPPTTNQPAVVQSSQVELSTANTTDHTGDHSSSTTSDHQPTTMCAGLGEDNCLTTQIAMPLPDTNDFPIVLIAGILGGVGAAVLFILLFLCVLLMVYKCSRRKRAIHTATAASNACTDFQGDGRSENPYDYIDSSTLPSSNHVQDAKTCSNVAYDAHTNTVIMAWTNEAYGTHPNTVIMAQSNEAYGAHTNSVIMAQSNEAYGAHTNSVIMAQSNEAYGVTRANINNENVVYETIGPAKSDKSKDKFETEANCAYGTHSDVMVVSPNHAYGVPITSKDV